MVHLRGRIDNPRAAGYGALIGDLYVRLGASPTTPIQMVTDDSLADRQESGVRSVNTYENLMKLGFVFSRFDLSGGEGLDIFPRPSQAERTELDALRFWDSSGLTMHRELNGVPPGIGLAREFGIKDTITAPADLAATSTQIIVTDADDVLIYDGWADSSPTTLTPDVGVSIIHIAASPGGDIAAIDETGSVWISQDGAAFTEELTPVGPNGLAEIVWYAKGRFICDTHPPAGGSQLIEIVVGEANLIIDESRDHYLAVVDAGMAIVTACSDGTLRTFVPQSDTAGVAPVLTQRAQTPLPPGETPYSLGWNAGVLLIKTAEVVGSTVTCRLYRGEVLDARFDFLISLSLQRTWEGTSEEVDHIGSMVATRDEIFWTVQESATTTTMWRMDLVSGGISRYNEILTASEHPHGLIFVDDALGLFADNDLIYQTDDFTASGWLITPKINFGLHTAINWVATTIDIRDLGPPGVSVEMYYSLNPDAIKDKDNSSWILIRNFTTMAQIGNEISILNATANDVALQIRLYASSTASESPLVTRFAIRGLPKHRDWVIDLPVNVSDMITARGRRPVYRHGWGDKIREELMKMQGEQIELSVFKPPLLMRGIIDAIGEPFTYISKRGSAGRVCTVRFRGSRLSIGASTGAAGMGISPMGIGTMGIQQLGD